MLSDDELETLCGMLKVEVYDSGKTIFNEGDPGNKLYFIIKGVVQIEKSVDEANYTRLARLKEGEVLGEIALLDASPRSASATAYMDSELYVLTRSQLDSLIKTQPMIAAKLFEGVSRVLAQRLRFADDEITQLTKRLYYF